MAWRWRSPRGQPCMEMKITMGRPRTWRWRSPCAVKRGYTISHIYKLPVKVYPFYAPFFCMVDVLSRVIPQRMSSTNASPIAAPSHIKYIQWRAYEIRVPLDLLEVMGLCRTLTRGALVDLSWLSKQFWATRHRSWRGMRCPQQQESYGDTISKSCLPSDLVLQR